MIFLPALTALFWAIVISMTSFRTDTFIAALSVFLTGFLAYFLDAVGNQSFVAADIKNWAMLLTMLVGPCIVPLAGIYLHILRHGSNQHPLLLLWLSIPAALFAVGVILYMLIGPEDVTMLNNALLDNGYKDIPQTGSRAMRYYCGMFVYFQRGIYIIESLWLIYYAGRCIEHEQLKINQDVRALRNGESCKLPGIQLINILSIAILMALKNPLLFGITSGMIWLEALLDVLLSAAIFSLGFFSLFGTKKTISKKDLNFITRYNYGASDKAWIVEEMITGLIDEAEDEALERIQEKLGLTLPVEEWKEEEHGSEAHKEAAGSILQAVADSWEEDELFVRFQHIMRDDMLFLQPRLSLDDVAERLGTNKVYVSRLANNAFNLSFPELINVMRIDYAEQYILKHRNAKQDEIARECGFLSASSFNTIFKKVTGMTPKVWVGSRDNTQNN